MTPEKQAAFIDYANRHKQETCEPFWSWDCNSKLDFDGPIISFSSRFYPPCEAYGPGWDGNVTVRLMAETIGQQAFKADTLLELRRMVENYKFEFVRQLKRAMALSGDVMGQLAKERGWNPLTVGEKMEIGIDDKRYEIRRVE